MNLKKFHILHRKLTLPRLKYYPNVEIIKIHIIPFFILFEGPLLHFLIKKKVSVQNFTSTEALPEYPHESQLQAIGDGFLYAPKSTLYIPRKAMISFHYNHLLTCLSPTLTALLQSKAFPSGVFPGSNTVPKPGKHQ